MTQALTEDDLIALNEGIVYAESIGTERLAMNTAAARALMDMARESLVAPDKVEATLRDRFAGQALTGLCANCDTEGRSKWTGMEDIAAFRAYQFADAMLAKRAEKGGAA